MRSLQRFPDQFPVNVVETEAGRALVRLADGREFWTSVVGDATLLHVESPGRVVFVNSCSNKPQMNVCCGATPLMDGDTGGVIFEQWFEFGQSSLRGHGLTGEYREIALMAFVVHANPVHYRIGTPGLFCWSSLQDEVGEGESPPENWGRLHAPEDAVLTAKVWHDLLVSEVAEGETGQDLLVALESEATSVLLSDGSPTGPAHTEGQACVVALDADTLEEVWRTCLEPFEIEVEGDGGIGEG